VRGDVFFPNKKLAEFPVESVSLSFKGGLVSKITRGYVADRTIGTTGGLLGAPGVLSLLGEGPASLSYLPPAVALKRFFGRNRKRWRER